MDIGFSLGFSDDEPIEDTLLQNLRFAESWHRERFRDLEVLAGRAYRAQDAHKMHLRERLRGIFDEVPEEAVCLVSDDKDSLIAEIVRTRNSLVHADQDPRTRVATGDRLKVVVMKLSVTLWLHVGLVYFGEEYVAQSVPGISGNPNIYKYLCQSDRPDDTQARFLGI